MTSPSSAQSELSDERINELALLNLGYDRTIRPLDFARAIEREVRAAASAQASGQAVACETCRDGELLPQYGVAPHDCYHKLGKSIGESEVHAAELWPDNFELDQESNGELGIFHCPDCGPKFKAGKPLATPPSPDAREAGGGVTLSADRIEQIMSLVEQHGDYRWAHCIGGRGYDAKKAVETRDRIRAILREAGSGG